VIYDLRLHIIEADRISNPETGHHMTPLPTQKMAGGIERDDNGVPIAIHIRTPHPALRYFIGITPYWTRVPIWGEASGRRNVLHLMDMDRIDQSRGEPVLTPIIETLKQVSRYNEAELMAAVVNAMLAVYIKRPLGDTASPGPSSKYEYDDPQAPWNRPNNLKLGTGSWIEGAPGDELQVVNAARPSNQFDPFFTACLKQIGMGLGLSYEVLLKAFNNSYSASRAAMLAAENLFEIIRAEFVDDFCQPVYEEFLIEAVIKGRLKAPGFLNDPSIRKAYSRAVWIGVAQGQIDEVKEVEAANKRVTYGFSTRAIETARMCGLNYKEVVRARAAEVKMEQRLGWSPAPPAGLGQPYEGDGRIITDGNGEPILDEDGNEIKESTPEAPAAGENAQGAKTTATTGAKAKGADVQGTALNGAQTKALQDITFAVADGSLPHASAKAIIKLAFPASTDEQIDAIIDPIEIKEPEPPAPFEPGNNQPALDGAGQEGGDAGV
jgi:lambda family phage portal protein